MASRFGEQPGLDLAQQQGWSVARLARRLHLRRSHVNKALYGYHRPAPELRAGLPALLGCTEAECFTDSALERPYRPLRLYVRSAR